MPTRGPAPEWVAALNTSLIVISGVFLLIGYFFIRRRNVEFHKRSMLTATVFAALFLVVYVTRAMLFETRLFAGEGLIRAVYLFILITHTILAILVGPFALVTLRRALRGEYAKHRRVARITFPMWLYVVVTGWLVYWMLSTHTNVQAY
jgi:putative membrane protein